MGGVDGVGGVDAVARVTKMAKIVKLLYTNLHIVVYLIYNDKFSKSYVYIFLK